MEKIKYTILYCVCESCHFIYFGSKSEIPKAISSRSDRIRNHNIDKNEEPPEYGKCEYEEWNMGRVKAGSGIRECESGEWNTGSAKAGSDIRGVRKQGVKYGE